MALARGTRLGPYEIVSAIGAGGMGEVKRSFLPMAGGFLRRGGRKLGGGGGFCASVPRSGSEDRDIEHARIAASLITFELCLAVDADHGVESGCEWT
jgi:hypothetical protein